MQVSITNLKQMKVSDFKDKMPFEITADGEVIGVMQEEYKPKKAKTKCPNCKLVYDYEEPDNKPSYFTIRHK